MSEFSLVSVHVNLLICSHFAPPADPFTPHSCSMLTMLMEQMIMSHEFKLDKDTHLFILINKFLFFADDVVLTRTRRGTGGGTPFREGWTRD